MVERLSAFFFFYIIFFLTSTVQGYSIIRERYIYERTGKTMDHTMNENAETLENTSEACEHCTSKTKERSEKEYKDMINRLSRIEGQIRGIKGMVEKDVYCTDILVQVAAVNAALNSFNRVLLANHIKTCVTQDILNGKEETVDELVNTLKKLMK